MAYVVANRVAEVSASTGTGAFALAASVPGYQRFGAACAVGDTAHYVIVADDGNWEAGLGTYSAANTLTRTAPYASTNAGAAVNFGAGQKQVFMSFGGVGRATAAATAKATPADTDAFPGADTGGGLFKTTWANIKSALSSIYATLGAAANFATVELRNGVTSQALYVYNTYTDATNYERGFARWNANVFEVGPDLGSGTGLNRSMRLTTRGGTSIIFAPNSGGGDKWTMDSLGNLTSVTDNTMDIGASGATRPRTGYFGTSVVTPTVVTPTNTNLLLNAAGVASVHLQINGVSKWVVDGQNFNLVASTDNSYDIGASGNRARSIYFGTELRGPLSGFIRLYNGTDNTGSALISSSSGNGQFVAYDSLGNIGGLLRPSQLTLGNSLVNLYADGSGVLAQRAGATAQSFYIYNTYTDSLNYDRWKASMSGSYAVVGTEAAGTGVARHLALRTPASTSIYVGAGGSDRWIFQDTGHLVANGDNTYDIGTSISGRPRTVYAATSVVTGTVNVSSTANAGIYGPSAGVLGLISNGVDRWRVDASGHFISFSDNSYDIGASGANRPRNIYAATGVTSPLVTAAGTGVPLNVDSTNSNNYKIALKNAGAATSYLGSSSTSHLLVANSAGTAVYTFDANALTIPGQIVFPATQNASANANTLDDYEEGTFTPTVAFTGGAVGITYSSQAGRYTKVGNRMDIDISIVLTSKGSSTGNLLIGGLPINPNAGNILPLFISGAASLSGMQIAQTASGSTNMNAYQSGTGTTLTMTDANLTNTSSIHISGTYFTA